MRKHIDTQAGNVRVEVTTEDGTLRDHHACILKVGKQNGFALSKDEAAELVIMLVRALRKRG